ncbi:MAG: thiamine-phosphate kinase [Candidatus Omnitrophota bacterium]
MLINKIGEFGLIERIRKTIPLDSLVVKGSGDDCAVIKFKRDKFLLFTCDMIVQDVDFTSKTNPYLVGRKALAVSISDIAACAGIPKYAVVSVGLPKFFTVEKADRVIKGLLDLAKKYKINIVGGDISKAPKLTLDVSLLGEVEKKYLALRSGAKVGDVIFVSGSLGGSILGKHLTFSPRLKEARFLVKNFKVNSMIDISDGLAADLGHILKESGVGAVIYEKLIPRSRQAKDLEDCLYSGEDFELLFTLSAKFAKRLIKRRLKQFSAIGEIVDKRFSFRLVDKNCKERIIKPKGFRHF